MYICMCVFVNLDRLERRSRAGNVEKEEKGGATQVQEPEAKRGSERGRRHIDKKTELLEELRGRKIARYIRMYKKENVWEESEGDSRASLSG